MCGIFCCVGHFDNLLSEYFLDRLSDRGPNGGVSLKDENAVIGQTRLAIVSPEDPLIVYSDERKNTFGVINGEIYNDRALREELKSEGHRFLTKIDVEVVVHAYEKWGLDFVDHLHGIFAFILYDKKRAKVIVGRDRLGIKPLYGRHLNGALFLSSSAKTLAQIKGHSSRIDPRRLVELMYRQSVLPPHTIYDDVFSILPGTVEVYSIYNPANASLQKKYWSFQQQQSQITSSAVLIDVFVERVQTACLVQLRSDVPIGIALSGGIDSALLSVIAADRPSLTRYFLDVPSTEYLPSELAWSQQIAHLSNSDLRILKFPDDVEAERQSWLTASDVPPADGFNIFLLAKVIPRTVKVLVTGLGADELFDGYVDLSRPLLRESGSSEELIQAFFLKTKLMPDDFLSGFARYLGEDLQSVKDELFERASLLIHSVGNRSPRNILRTLLIEFYLSPCLLRDADNFSMSNAIELRVPYLDDEIVDFAMSRLSPSVFEEIDLEKRILRIAAQRLGVPQPIANAPKHGFALPYALLVDKIGLAKTFDSRSPLASYRNWVTANICDWLSRYGLDIQYKLS